ncbi:MAG: DUF4386 family protein [Anaerolineae bacterium]
MQDHSLRTVGSVCAILVGVMGALASIVYLLLPPEQRLGVPAAQILPSYAKDGTMLNVEFLLLTLVGVFGLGAVPAITRFANTTAAGWTVWAGNLALVGFAIQAVSNFFTFTRMPGIATAFVAGADATKAALVPIWRSSLDLDGLWGFGAVGLWVIVISLLALRAKSWSPVVSYLGFGAGVFYLLFVVGFVFKQPVLFLVASVAGTVAATIWYIWIGLTLRREPAAAPGAK